MKIDNVKVYDLPEALVCSGLPMQIKYNADVFAEHVEKTADIDKSEDKDVSAHLMRCRCLTSATIAHGSGHDNFLSGILVSMNITATVKWWEQFQRYHFKQIVSSMSTMHRLRWILQQARENGEPYSCFEDGVSHNVIDEIHIMSQNSSVTNEQLAYSCPMGLLLTARINTNYLSLRTMFLQRRNHKLAEWRVFCNEIAKLPLARDFIVR